MSEERVKSEYEKEIEILQSENEKLKQEICSLKESVESAQRKCACFRNNKKLLKVKNEDR